MQVEIFYTTKTDNAKKLVLLTEEEYKKSSITKRIKLILLENDFSGKSGDISIITNEDGLLDSIYLGISEKDDPHALITAMSKIPPGVYSVETKISDEAILNWSLEQYKFDKFKKTSSKPRVLVVEKNKYQEIIAKSAAIFLVRDLINMPANELGPKELSMVVASIAKDYGAEFSEIVGEDLITKNFPAIYAVGKASESKPRLLSLSWGQSHDPLVTLVGKGVCFDSGGLDIKSADGMRLMKKDMGGAANALGLAKWIMSEKLPVRLQLYIPAVENSISSNAYRPGDVLTMRNGMTVEIDNTDAEGRLVLADAIVRACEDKPEILIDFATLTGAARIAVGTDISAMFCNNDDFADDILDASKNVKDPVWRMPLFSGYRSLFDSQIADMANASKSSYGGAITAALFLENYVSKDVKWAHFDIMAWNLSAKPGRPVGGEAMAILAIADYLGRKHKIS